MNKLQQIKEILIKISKNEIRQGYGYTGCSCFECADDAIEIINELEKTYENNDTREIY
jgi:hypothetical protein